MKIAVVLFVTLAEAATLTPCYCQDAHKDRTINTVRGKITAIDWVGSTIVIRWFNGTEELTGEKLAFLVPRETIISKHAYPIGLAELKISDHVSIKYYRDSPSGELKAVSIKVLEPDRPIPP